jgi:predicted nucleotidyltransferase
MPAAPADPTGFPTGNRGRFELDIAPRSHRIKAMEVDFTKKLVACIREAAHPLRVVLFGSAARGEDRPDSDVDVLVVVPDGTARRKVAGDIYERLAGLERPVDVVVVTTEDVERYRAARGLVIEAALREGREIYAA